MKRSALIWACVVSGSMAPGSMAGQERWTDPSIFDLNREPPHATLIPFANRNGALTRDPGNSPFHLSLNGDWRFRWVEKPADAPEGFHQISFGDESWDLIPVPSNWEVEGYGVPLYKEAGVLPGPPGFVDASDNPVGSYRRWIEIPDEWDGLQVFLHFASVGSAVQLWMNAWEVRKVYQPISVEAPGIEDRSWSPGEPLELVVLNRFDFLDLDPVVTVVTTSQGPNILATDTVHGIQARPHSSTRVRVRIPDWEARPGAEAFIKVESRLKEPMGVLPANHLLAWDQFRLPADQPRMGADLHRAAKISPRVEGSRLFLEGEATNFQMVFDLEEGQILNYTFQGETLLLGGPRPNFWRPPTDNDFGNDMPGRSGIWREASAAGTVKRVEHWQNSDRDVEIFVTRSLESAGGSLHRVHFHVFGNGEVIISTSFEPAVPDLPDLPKFGLTLTLPDELSQVEWFGRGPHENYSDRKSGAGIGIHRATVDELYTPYIRPQENGNRTDVRWVALTGEGGVGLLAVADSVFQFSALHFDDTDFDEGDQPTHRHVWDLIRKNHVTLDLDLAQMGVGGDTSWGARPHPEYRIPVTTYNYRLRLLPFVSAEEDLWDLTSRKW